jgi:hypothetical protein
MPTPIQHLALAEGVLQGADLSTAARRLLTEQRGPFLLGTTAPDVQIISGQERQETHFYSLWTTSSRPAYEEMFAAHPSLALAQALPLAQAAFVAGYISHLLLDELWLHQIFWPHFWQSIDDRHECAFLHNVLRTWMDRQDRRQVNGSVAAVLHEVEPHHWLTFASDEHLRCWRDWLTEQLLPGRVVRTAEVFAQRMGVRVEAMEAVLQSPREMETAVLSRIPPFALDSFRSTGYERSVALIEEYLICC